MRGGAVAISAVAFAWVVVQAQGGCGTEVAPAEPESPAVEAPAVEAARPEVEAAEPPDPPPEEPPEPEAVPQAPAEPNPPPAASNRNAKEKAFFPASKAGVLHPPEPAPQQQQANPAPTP